MPKTKLSLVLPIHNQGSFIQVVVAEIVKVLDSTRLSFEIILVENGSTDHTYSVLQNMAENDPRMKLIVASQGYGSAIIAGLGHSEGEWVSYMPSDGQISASVLVELIREMQLEQFDVVKIRRISRESQVRFIRSKVFNILGNLIFGRLPVLDINGSPRIFKREGLRILKLSFKDSFIDVEFARKAKYLKWKIKEVPAETLPRAGGKSTVSFKTVIEFLRNMIQYRLNFDFELWKKKIQQSEK